MKAPEESVAINLPLHHQRWTQVALALGAVGYGVMLVWYLIEGRKDVVPELLTFLTCVVALSMHRNHPRFAGGIGVAAVWLEIAIDMMLNPGNGFDRTTVLVFPVLIVGAAQLYGTRGAWLLTFGTSVFVPAVMYFNAARWGITWDSVIHSGGDTVVKPYNVDDQIRKAIIFALSLLATAGLMNSLFRTIKDLVRGERDQAARVAEILEQAPEGLVAVDATGIARVVNELAEEYLGLKREEIIGKEVGRIEGFPFDSASLPQAEQRGPTVQVEQNGRILEFQARRVRQDEKGMLPAWIFVVRDVTERKIADERASSLAQRLQDAQRMEAIGKLAGGVAHDFNNLLTAVGASAELLEDSSDEKVRDIASELDKATARGAALTGRLLTFANRGVVREATIDLAQLAQGLESTLRRDFQRQVTIRLEAEPSCFVRADEGHLEQVIFSLVANAAEAVDEKSAVEVAIFRQGEEVALRVKDQGRGIAKEDQARVFEPFFTTKGAERGRGLGLSTVHGILERWKGRIELESAPGEGTVVRVFFPYVAPPARPERRPVVASSIPPPQVRSKILLVEDDPLVRRFTERILSPQYDLVVAKSSEEALQLWKEGERPDLLLTDVLLPGMSGPELAILLRKEQPDLPVLLASGYVDDVLERWPFDPKEDLLLKPVEMEELLERVRSKLQSAQRDA